MSPAYAGGKLTAVQSRLGGAIDLPDDMQRQLRDLESRGDRMTHYELLGVPADVDGGAVRRAYLEKSKRFHPDAWYRRELGEFGPLLSKWFQRLAAAYQVLSDEESRNVYDREHKKDLSESDKAALKRRELSRSEQERRSREGRERLLRSKGFARIGAARKLFEEAERLVENGERSNAIAALKAARELDPNRKEIATRLIELERDQARGRAQSALMTGKEREEEGLFPQAIAAYGAAFQQDPALFSAAMGAARCSMQNGDLQTASTWAARAVELNPTDPVARIFLANAFKTLNMKARARAELNALLAVNPDHKEAKALLRGL
jgi:curved DNA-binding protein CbpA